MYMHTFVQREPSNKIPRKVKSVNKYMHASIEINTNLHSHKYRYAHTHIHKEIRATRSQIGSKA